MPLLMDPSVLYTAAELSALYFITGALYLHDLHCPDTGILPALALQMLYMSSSRVSCECKAGEQLLTETQLLR